VDVWLNNPLPPFEASGTSGMKAILNGVLQLSTLDGWVVEAADKNVGWIFGWQHHGTDIGDEHALRFKEDSDALYTILEQVVGLYYDTNRKGALNGSSDWLSKMADAVAAGSFFNTDRMVADYQKRIWEL
jgi:starch phosphorylase